MISLEKLRKPSSYIWDILPGSWGIEKFCNVGGGPLLKALHALHSREECKLCFHYAILCMHIAEPLHFHGIVSTVSRGPGGYNRYNCITLTTNEQKFVKSWKMLSKYYMTNDWPQC